MQDFYEKLIRLVVQASALVIVVLLAALAVSFLLSSICRVLAF